MKSNSSTVLYVETLYETKDIFDLLEFTKDLKERNMNFRLKAECRLPVLIWEIQHYMRWGRQV